MPDVRIAVTDSLTDEAAKAVLDLAAAAAAQDGRRPLSEQTELRLRPSARPGAARHLLARLPGSPDAAGPDGDVVGYAGLEPGPQGASAELVVDPAHRRQGVAGELAGVLETAALETAPPDVAGAATVRLRVWAHGDHPGARALATRLGYGVDRELWLMRRSPAELPPVPDAPGVRLRSFRPGPDDETWVALNAAAFASHPEQGRMTLADLHARMAEPWFDPDGLIVAEDTGTGEVLGFHWTKVHTDGPAPVGEVYVVGVSPAAQGRGLGKVLTLAGLQHLARKGLGEVLLYVEADNAPALAVYRRLGFEVADSDVMFGRDLPR